MATHFVSNPYARGVLKIAPIKVSIEDQELSVYNIDDGVDLLEPLKDIIDICGINPSSITFSINTLASEDTGRDIGLNMHRDILGRVRDFSIDFPPMSNDKYSNLKKFLLDKTETITVKEIDNSVTPTVEKDVQKKEYIIWWLIEILLPESTTPIRDVVYLGDSSFTGVELDYLTKVINIFDEDGNIQDYYNEIKTTIAKNLKINFAGKTKIDPNLEL